MHFAFDRLKKQHLWLTGVLLVLSACGGPAAKHDASQADSTAPKEYFRVDSTLSAPFGVRTACMLPDSGTVILNSASKLQYAVGFPKENRDMSLDGDAFFTLHGGDHPARIHTGMLILTSQGARFRVYAHSESRGQSVEVLSGLLQAVKAYPSDYPDTEALRAGDMVMINRDIDLMEKETFDTAALAAWLEGTLSFNKASFGDVVRNLEDWYDLDITVTGNPRPEDRDTLTATFTRQPLPVVLKQLAVQGDFTYKVSGNTVDISLP